MNNAYKVQTLAVESVVAAVDDEQRVMRMVQYFSEESQVVTNELAAGIATIEHQRNVLEAIYTMAGKALGKF